MPDSALFLDGADLGNGLEFLVLEARLLHFGVNLAVSTARDANFSCRWVL